MDDLNSTEITQRHYAIIGKLGEGAMGEIVLAQDEDLRRKVAYKKLLPDIADNEEMLEQFLTEAQITAQLEHPNIVPIYGLEVNASGQIAYSMKMIQGKTLDELIKEAAEAHKKNRPIPVQASRAVMLEHLLKVCDAMHYAHMRGVIHRDLKPSNIMIGPYNEVYVLDWGVARVISPKAQRLNSAEQAVELKSVDDLQAKTEKKIAVGTPRYMSPQQAAGRNEQLNGQSDQFSLGLILYEILCYEKAYKAKSMRELFTKLLKVEYTPIEQAKSGIKVPKELKAIIAKATAKKPSERYPSLEEFSQDIRRYQQGQAVVARPDTPIEKALRWMSHHKESTAMVVMTLLLFSFATLALNMYRHAQKLEQASQHEHQLSAFLNLVNQESERINNQFIQVQTQVEDLGATVSYLLSHPPVQSQPIFTMFGTPPPKLIKTALFSKPISTEYWVAKLAPELSLEQSRKSLQQLIPLHDLYRDFILSNIDPGLKRSKDHALKSQAVAERQRLVIGVYVGLENGAFVVYPGTVGYPKAYDPRLRAWYKEAQRAQEFLWTKLFVSISGLGLLMGGELPIYNEQGELLGVVGVDMTMKQIQKDILNFKRQGVDAVYLLNPDGNIVMSSRQQQDYKISNKERQLNRFEIPEVLQAMKNQASGYFIQDKKLYVYARMQALNWYYVVAGDEATLLKGLNN